MSDPNFNINLQVDKVMDKISESKTLRKWTYIIALLAIIGLIVIYGGDFLKGMADLLRARDGR